MMLVSERTRAGPAIAIVCAIMPPIETPTTCADVDAEVVEQPERVVGHVLEGYGGRTRRPAKARTSVGALTRPAARLERPVSRLS